MWTAGSKRFSASLTLSPTLWPATPRTRTDLADHVGTEQQHHDALPRDSEKYKRVHALNQADLGDSLAAEARADEAVAAWTHALVLLEGMTSDRTREAITSICSALLGSKLMSSRKSPWTPQRCPSAVLD